MPVLGSGNSNTNTGAVSSPTTTASPNTSAIAGLLTGTSLSGQLAGNLAAQAAPAEAQQGLTAALGGAQLAMTPAQLGVSEAELTSQTGGTLANALLGYEGIGVQSQGLGQQAGTEAAQQGEELAQYGVSQTQYPEQQAEAALQNQNTVRSLKDNSAISGTTETAGAKQALATQQAEYGWNQADIYRQQQLAALGQQSEATGFTGQEEQIANAQQQLSLAAQGQGVTAQQATDQLSFGLQALGVGASPEQYLAGIANAQSGEASSLAGVGSQAALIGGLGPMTGLFGGY
jgi:hypothetical protein